MQLKYLVFVSVAALISQQPLFAQTSSTPTAQGDVSVTIYYNDLALVQDVRRISLPSGRSRQEFPDVSAQIRPETVTLSGDGIGIVEQNFDYDLLSPASLMEKAVGQTITLLRTNPATGVETREQATVLAANGGVVLKIGERIEVLRDDGLPVRVIFSSIPPNLRARPTLNVTMDAAQAGPRPVTLSYLTPAMGWKSDYVALFDEKASKLDMQGWITLNNSTGTTFTNVRALLVAGEVGQVQQRYNGYDGGRPQPLGNIAGTESGGGEQLGDFHAYPIEGRTTIANAQTKQVSFLDASGVPAMRGYEYRNDWMESKNQAESAASVLKFSNAKAAGIGEALPAGTVRVYMRDTRGQAQFVGESAIPHTPGGSTLALRTGDAFDVKVQPVVEKRDVITADEWTKTDRWRVTYSDGRKLEGYSERPVKYYRTQMRYIVTNAKPTPVNVDVVQSGLARWWWWRDLRIPEESIKGVQETADMRRWVVPVPANGKVELTATFLTPW
ncbi:DUF4139 domain-containing protein [Sphingobium sp. LB126]|uniref:DUF4139 domain-containing protein n=1 Tax=Sphingobium sp. LB126 TaxID=1983755 RepID=UPI000C20C706|nr:DUF4139 domain-containing protein [Sphingobium sp. LB126]PJG45925.1 DUF4139 domain-containing protein [Sphingobium sp. LB126]